MSRNPLVQRARSLRKTMTRPEVLLWLELRTLKPLGFRFRRQVPLLSYVVDFACFSTCLVIEVDGFQHGFEQNRAADETRDSALNAHGFRVLRFSNEDVLMNRSGVIETILSSSPSPERFRAPGRGMDEGAP